MQQRLSSPAQRRRRTVSLTPLIDVVFILLIFFVMAGRFEQDGRITLARADGPADMAGDAAQEQERRRSVLVIVAADGSLNVGGSTLDAGSLARSVDPDTLVVLRLAADLAVGSMVETIDSLRAEGLDRLSYLAPARD